MVTRTQRTATLALLGALATACREKQATQLLVVVGTDIPVGEAQLERVEVEVYDGAGTTLRGQRSVFVSRAPTPPTTVAIPFSFGVVPADDGPDRTVQVLVRGRFRESGLRDRVVLRAITGFVEDRKLLLPMFLQQRCIDHAQCADGLTCIDGTCQSAVRRPDSLQSLPESPFNPMQAFDGGTTTDTSPPTDTSPDVVTVDSPPADVGPMDAGPMDAGPTDAGPVDAGPMDAGPMDAGPMDAGPVDAGTTDAGATTFQLRSPLQGQVWTSARPEIVVQRTGGTAEALLCVCTQTSCASTGCTPLTFDTAGVARWRPVSALPRGRTNVEVWSNGERVARRIAWTPEGARAGTNRPGRPWRSLLDFDGDGVPELAVGSPGLGVNTANGSARIYFESMQPGIGGDPFAMRQRGAIILPGSNRLYASDLAVAGDLDADGFVDLVVADPTGNTAEIVWGRADTLSMPERSPLPMRPQSNPMAETVTGAGDLDGDGYADLALSATRMQGHAGFVVFFGARRSAGPLRTAEPAAPAGLARTEGAGFPVGVGDLDGDGYADLAVGTLPDPAWPDGVSNPVYLYFGNSTGIDATPLVIPPPMGQSRFGQYITAAGDVTGDGLADALIFSGDGLYLLPGNIARGALVGAPRFVPIQQVCPGEGRFERAAGVGDLNGDGFDDVVFAARGRCAMVLAGSSGGVALGGMRNFPGPASGPNPGGAFADAVAMVGDVNGDGLPDFAVSGRFFDSMSPMPEQRALFNVFRGSVGFFAPPMGMVDEIYWEDNARGTAALSFAFTLQR